MEWYYVENGQQAGPVDEASLVGLVQQGRVSAQTLIWNSTMSNWQAYGEVAAQLAAGGVATLPAAPAVTAQASAYCAECGRPFPTDEMVQYGAAWVCAGCKPVFFQKIKEGVAAPSQFVYAGFWIRFGAKFIDGLMMFALMIPLGLLFGGASASAAATPNPVVRFFLAFQLFSPIWFIQMAFAIGYYVYLLGRYGQTLGKMACGIRVIRPDGQPITYGRAFGRYVAENIASFVPLLNFIVLLVSVIMLVSDREKRALHDRICDTRVVYKQ